MNSADKIKDDNSLAPQGTLLGMERTVLKSNEISTWFNSVASSGPNIPLDLEMGTGHLNAKRALTQFTPGESHIGDLVNQSTNVPKIWMGL